MIKIPVPPYLTGPQARMLIDLIDWRIEAIIDWQHSLRRTHQPWDLEADEDDWNDEIPV